MDQPRCSESPDKTGQGKRNMTIFWGLIILIVAGFSIGLGMVNGDLETARGVCRENGYDRIETYNAVSVYCSKLVYVDYVNSGSDVLMKFHAVYGNINGEWSLINAMQEGFAGFPTYTLEEFITGEVVNVE
jgi:hypothetical protein